MYVEITGRKTGKTTRIIDSIVDFLKQNPDKTALIVAKGDNRKIIQEKVYHKCGKPCEYRTITSYKMLPASPSGTIKQFVDDFGLIKDLELDPKAYYTGTPPLNRKAMEIWDYHKEYRTLTPSNILKRHKL
tara:strand:- start:476 stop:868 length:393 start_codon:yes stop_codon:yes gene_type:complete